MPEQALYLKWRPMTFADVIGQEHVTHTLQNALRSGRVRHAYLFSGPRGTGKTTTARLLAKAVNCREEDPANRPCNVCAACVAVNENRYLDLIEIDAATHTGVDDVRDLRDRIAFAPGEGRYKVYIIDEVHRFTGNAFDALLKTLEEPPDHAIFVLATTEIDRVPATIKSRCLQFEFRRVSLKEVADRLEHIAGREGLQIERAALELIARQGTGSVRDSISLLDQIVTDPAEIITLELAQRILGTANMQAVKDLAQALIDGDVAQGLYVINQAVDSGSDPRQFGQQMVEHLRAVLLAQTASADLIRASAEELALYHEQAGMVGRGALLRAVRAFNEAVNTYRGGWQPQLSLELALIESVRGADMTPDEPPPPQRQPRQEARAPHAAAKPVDGPQAAAGIPGTVSLQALKDKWVQVQRASRAHHASLPALLEHAHVRQVNGSRVVIGVLNDVFREKLDSPDKRQSLEHALGDVHGVELRVQIERVDSEEPPFAAPDTPIEDPLVRFGVEELGAEVRPADDET